MRIEPLGEEAYLLSDLGSIAAHTLAAGIEDACLLGIIEAVPSYATVGIYVEPDRFDADSFLDSLGRLALPNSTPRRHDMPVCFDLALDAAEVQEHLARPWDTIVSEICGVDLHCFAIGFRPGFPYLGYLPPELSGVPRRTEPRPTLPPGSVGITGRQAAIYPQSGPAGWRIVGRTPLVIVDVEDGYFPISAGDIVRFVPITRGEFDQLEGSRL